MELIKQYSAMVDQACTMISNQAKEQQKVKTPLKDNENVTPAADQKKIAS